MKLIKLRLKGFKGIKAGMGLDEIEIDFTQLPEGLTVISAPNGTGKTTILDNMHPYRLLPYRTGNSYRPTAFSYYDHTYGDAEKELIFQLDEVTYRSLLLIDTDRKKSEAYLYNWGYGDPGKWIPEPGIDSKLESYDRAIETVLGSPELFFTSIFRAQNAKQLADYAKGDIKDLFTELLCIDNLKLISEKARRIKQDLSGKVEILMIERKRLQDIIAKEGETRANIDNAIVDISSLSSEITSYEQEIIALQEQINECDVKIHLQRKAREEKDKIEIELREKQTKLDEITKTSDEKADGLHRKYLSVQGKVGTAEALIAGLPLLRSLSSNQVAKQEELETVKLSVTAADDNLITLNASLNEILSLDKQIADKQSQLSTAVQKRRYELDASERDLAEAKKQAEYIKNSGCPVENPSCNLMKAAIAQRDKIPDIECDIDFYSMPARFEIDLQAEIDALKAKQTDPQSIRDKITATTNNKNVLVAKQRMIETEIQDIIKAIESLPLAEQAEKDLPGLKDELTQAEAEWKGYTDSIVAEMEALKGDIEELTIRVIDATDTDPDYQANKQEFVDKQSYYRKEIEEARTRDADLKKSLGAYEETLRQIDKAKEGLGTVTARITYLNDEISQWATLEKAFGNDGIIALEIDDAGPSVSAIANNLLQTFGGRFSVRIDTQSAKADGKGNKEVFDIAVFDNQTNEVKSIKRLSGGEKTWVEDAVTKAICIYNKTASGRQFRTIMTDEKDGALDAEKKKEFFAMKRRVLELGGYNQEFCITQTPELIAMADAVIKLSKETGVEIITQ
ncbi:MAG: chromosome segregation protein [Syntrophorhabdus sp. PtaU1.Bin153]|nr:MAG: chromosome segregation protein [Syntrophorhabdus sp. PtaU1.Bin153]